MEWHKSVRKHWKLYCGDAVAVLRGLPDSSVDYIVTLPTCYWVRGQIGLEEMVDVYATVSCLTMDNPTQIDRLKTQSSCRFRMEPAS